MTETLRLLGIYAHPHDFTHTAGTCGNHVQRGDAVTVVSLTDGGATHNEELWEELQKPAAERDPEVLNQSRDVYTEQKTAELRQAAGYFGISDVRILPYEDRPLHRTDAIVQDVADIICEVRPDILLTQGPIDIFADRLQTTPDDHATCAAIVAEALTVSGCARPGVDRVPHRPAQIFYIAVNRAYDQIDFYIDISDQYENRLKAEMCFLSQGHTESYCRKRMESGIGHFGWYSCVPYAEPFVRGSIKLGTHLPVTAHELRASRESGLMEIKRVSKGYEDNT